MSITDGMENLLSPLKLIKVPVHDIAITMSIALRFIPILIEEIDKIIMAQKARGANFDTGNLIKRIKALLPVLIPLFVSAFRRADDLAAAMDARCYNATPHRTKLKELKLHIRDFIALFLAALLITFVVRIDSMIWIIFGI
jgi:energy-coupling factor transport system permease protein